MPEPVAGYAMEDTIDAASFLIRDGSSARMVTLIAAHRLSWFQSRELVEPQPSQMRLTVAGDSRLRRYLLAGVALTPKGGNLINNSLRRRPIQPMRPGAAIAQPA